MTVKDDDPRMNILHIIPDLAPSSGGPAFAVLGMARAQSELGHSVTIAGTDFGQSELSFPNVSIGAVIARQHSKAWSKQSTSEIASGTSCPRNDVNIKAFGDDIQIHLYPCDFLWWRWSSKLKEALYVHIKDSDIVHLHTLWYFPILAAADVCTQLAKPYLLRPCGMLDPWSLTQKALRKKLYLWWFGTKIIAQAAAIHFTSEGERLGLSARFGAVSGFICPLGVSSKDYEDLPEPSAFRKRFPELGADPILLFLGRLHYKKQPEIVIRAFQELIERTHRVRLVMAGSGDPKEVFRLKRLVNDLGLAGRVLFPGMLSGQVKKEALSTAALFVLPSLHENFGISIVEAMAASCPVVVSDRVNIASDILQAQAGVVCSPAVKDVAQAMEVLLHQPELRRHMGENGRKLVWEKFDWKVVVQSLLNEYDRILTRGVILRNEVTKDLVWDPSRSLS